AAHTRTCRTYRSASPARRERTSDGSTHASCVRRGSGCSFNRSPSNSEGPYSPSVAAFQSAKILGVDVRESKKAPDVALAWKRAVKRARVACERHRRRLDAVPTQTQTRRRFGGR